MNLRDLVEAIRFPAEDDGPNAMLNAREVRSYVREALAHDAGRLNLDDAETMAAEIATNALLYTLSGTPGGGLRVAAYRNAERVRLEFEDEGGAPTLPTIPDAVAETGRGLMIVRELSARWGTWQSQDAQRRVTVWFEMELKP